jgi:hypothetical protein
MEGVLPFRVHSLGQYFSKFILLVHDSVVEPKMQFSFVRGNVVDFIKIWLNLKFFNGNYTNLGGIWSSSRITLMHKPWNNYSGKTFGYNP